MLQPQKSRHGRIVDRGNFHAPFRWDRPDQRKIPDEPKISTFRHLIKLTELGEQIYCFAEDLACEAAKAHLKERGIDMKYGTIFDVTLIAASSSNKKKEGKREEMEDKSIGFLVAMRQGKR